MLDCAAFTRLVLVDEYKKDRSSFGKKGKQGKSFKAVKNIDSILVFYFLKAFYYPEHVGLAIGKADSPKVVFLEVHYDNPQHLEGTENLVMGS